MQVSDLFIRRPVFAVVVSLLLIVGGLASLINLPVREYPSVDRPVVSVSTVYRGASNEVIESRVTEIIEGAVAGHRGHPADHLAEPERPLLGLDRVRREPRPGSRDLRRARRGLPRDRPPAGRRRHAGRPQGRRQRLRPSCGSASPRPRLDALELSDFLKRVYVDRLSTVPGVANVYLGGERRYAMRIWVDRPALAARGLTVQDVETAIKRQNVELPGGRIESSQRELTVKTDSRLATPEEFEQVIVSNKNGYLVRLGEVARVEVGAEDTRFEFYQSGKTAIGLGIVRQSTANTLSVADARARRSWSSSTSSLPPGTTAEVLYDESQFIRASINGVLKTLLEGIGLVILVILLFLRDWRSTIVAMVAIPVSIIAAFMVMAFFGASINVLTLLAIVLAIGIVVDDAIVEIENVHRRIEEGQPPLLASFDGAREIGFAVIATTATLMAVFVPLAFMTGNTGKLFREFAITLAAAIFFSGVVARTLTPMMCSKLMVPAHGRIQRMTEPLFTGMNNGYRWLLSRALQGAGGHPLPRRRRVALGLQPVPGAAEGVRADGGPRRHHHPHPGARRREPRLHPRAGEGGGAGAHAAAGAGRRRVDAEPGRAGLRASLAGQCGHRHRAPRALGGAHHEAAGRSCSSSSAAGRELPRRARLPAQPALLRRRGRLRPADPVRARRPRLRHPARAGATSSCRRRRKPACSSTSTRTTASPSPTSASRSTASAPPTSASRSRISAAPSS